MADSPEDRLAARIAEWADRPLPDAQTWERAGQRGERDARAVWAAGLKRYLGPKSDSRLMMAYGLGALVQLVRLMRVAGRDDADARFVLERYAVGYVRAAARGLDDQPGVVVGPIEADGSAMREAGPMPTKPNA